MTKLHIIPGSILLLIVILALVVLQFAPETSFMFLSEDIEQVACLEDSAGDCLVMPNVSGINIDNQELLFPEAFSEDYYLIVMPFDRTQQVLAVTWLPLFRELAAEHDGLHYFSIAALPDLNSAIRLLVIGGMSASVSEAEIRSQIAVLFLEEQDTFLNALAIDDTEAIQIFVVNREGVIFYRDSGDYKPDKGEFLRDFIENLQV